MKWMLNVAKFKFLWLKLCLWKLGQKPLVFINEILRETIRPRSG
jgi:hypothetical protein